MEKKAKHHMVLLRDQYTDAREECDKIGQAVLDEIEAMLSDERAKFASMKGGLHVTPTASDIEDASSELEQIADDIRERLAAPHPNFAALFDRDIYGLDGNLIGIIDPDSIPPENWLDTSKPEQ